MRQVAFGVLDQNGVELSPSWRAAYIRQTGRYFFRGGGLEASTGAKRCQLHLKTEQRRRFYSDGP